MERISDYFDLLLQTLREHSWVIHEELTFRQIDDHEGYVRGTLHLYGGFSLHVAEYVRLEKPPPVRMKYRYQLLDSHGAFVARWDNAPHHQDISTHPFHKHSPGDIIEESAPMTIFLILDGLDNMLAENF